jgi:hypothetical protein
MDLLPFQNKLLAERIWAHRAQEQLACLGQTFTAPAADGLGLDAAAQARDGTTAAEVVDHPAGQFAFGVKVIHGRSVW